MLESVMVGTGTRGTETKWMVHQITRKMILLVVTNPVSNKKRSRDDDECQVEYAICIEQNDSSAVNGVYLEEEIWK